MQKVLALALPLFLLFSGGCSVNTGGAQRAVNVSARIIVETDRFYSILYEAKRIETRLNSETWEERDKKMLAWDEVATLIQASYRWIVAAEAAIDAWEQTEDDRDFRAAVGCLLKTFDELMAGFKELGLEPIPGLNTAVNMLRGVTTDKCEVLL